MSDWRESVPLVPSTTRLVMDAWSVLTQYTEFNNLRGAVNIQVDL